MCKVTLHCQGRSVSRWGVPAKKAIEEVKGSRECATVVGDYLSEDMTPRQLLLDVKKHRVIVFNPNEDAAITCWKTNNTPLALDMYEDVIALHRKRINRFHRTYQSLMKKYNAKKDSLEAERDAINEEIARLKLKRDHISAQLDNYIHDIRKVNEQKKLTIHSLANYLTFDESEYKQKEVN